MGCGTGTWLSIFQKSGVTDILGVDGPWVKPDLLFIPQSKFIEQDLTKPISNWVIPNESRNLIRRTFELAVSLEVAEHLEAQYADTFIESLIALAPVVLFSAAIPDQGGTHHVNEQWPGYWVEKFGVHGYVVIDALRRLVWSNERVSFWYAQNIFFFVKEQELPNYPGLQEARSSTYINQLALVHPRNSNYNVSLKTLLRRKLYELIINPTLKLFGK